MHFELVTKRSLVLGRKRYFVRLRADNGEILCHSETLNTRQAAITNLSRTRECFDVPVEEVEE